MVGLQTALDNKVDDSQVLTNVPSGATFDVMYNFADYVCGGYTMRRSCDLHSVQRGRLVNKARRHHSLRIAFAHQRVFRL